MADLKTTRESVIHDAATSTDDGSFLTELKNRVSFRTESQAPHCGEINNSYLENAVSPALATMGFHTTIYDNPISDNHPVLVGQRIEDPTEPTVLLYGHGDVQFGHPDEWSDGLSPWDLTRKGNVIYGRGTADNKGQHLVNEWALRTVLKHRAGHLGYNVKILIETAEEFGSVGLKRFVEEHQHLLSCDLFIGSDGPRVDAEIPTVFLGSRGVISFWLNINLRERSYHSGNWGGRLRNPATTLCAAIETLVSRNGVIKAPFLRPSPIPSSVKEAICVLPTIPSRQGPSIDPTWGEPGLSPMEKTLAWNGLEVIAMRVGNPDSPVGAIPGKASALLQFRFVAGTDVHNLGDRIHQYLIDYGFSDIDVAVNPHWDNATRQDPSSPLAKSCEASIKETTQKPNVAMLPNFGGSLPNAVFRNVLNTPTLWIPHSYPGCNQHAADENNLVSLLQESLMIMAGIFWDLGDTPDNWFSL